MRTLIVLALASSLCFGETIDAVGYGQTPTASILDAKRQAIDRVSGSFVIGHVDVQGNMTYQNINQYSSGFIKEYQVVSTEKTNSLYVTTIRADVQPGKINDMSSNQDGTVSQTMIDQLTNAQYSDNKLMEMLDVVTGDRNKFITRISKLTYDTHGDQTTVTVDYQIKWSPKWYDDLLTLMKASKQRVSLFGDKKFGVCFVGDRHWLFKSVDCYDSYRPLNVQQQHAFNIVGYQGLNQHLFDAVRVDLDPLIYGKPFSDKQDGVTMYKNGVVESSYTFVVSTQLLQTITRYEVIAQ